MNTQNEIEKIQQAIRTLEDQRKSLGDDVVETALTQLRAKLASLQGSHNYEQRKLATVLFADLVGFTAVSAKLDPEDMRELLNAYFNLCSQIIEQHGGVVEKFIGDAVMAVFGLKTSKEDDPERAVQAGLEITQVLERLATETTLETGQDLAVRVGITTGEVVVGALGERQEGEWVVVGEAVNLASRLQSEAPPGGVLITYDSYRHVQGVFDVQPVEPLKLKGISGEVQAYLVKAVKPRAFRMVRRGVEGIETRVVGRETELNQIREAFQQVSRENSLRVVTVVGEAGIGKSRLIAEIERWLDLLPQKVYYFKGRAHSSMRTSPYSLVRDMFAFRFQIQDSDPPSAVRRKLEQGYADAFRSSRPQGDRHSERRSVEKSAHFLGRLLGFEFGPSEHLQPVEQDARGLHDQALVYLRDYFNALGSDNPVVILLEDLHWADDSSLDLIQLLEGALRGMPLLIVGAARPSLFERRPQWGEHLPYHILVKLGPLSRQDSLALVNQILHKVEDPLEKLSDLVVGTAEGNPFYIEELLKMLIEDGIIQTQEERWRVESARLSEIHVPPTLIGVLQARFDNLNGDEKFFLQRGSVIGRVFWDKAIEYLGEAGSGSASSLDLFNSELAGKLRKREMIFERDNSTFTNTREYLFKHALLRDVIYKSLLKRQRRTYHQRTALWLEQVTQRIGRTDEFASLIAAHYEQSGEPTLAAGWYWRAGLGAAARYANAEALYAFTRTLELTPQEDIRRQIEILFSREKVYELQGEKKEQLRDVEHLYELGEKLADPATNARVALRRAAYDFSVSDFPGVIAFAQKAMMLAQSVKVMDIAAESDLLRANALIRQGSLEEAREYVQRGLNLAHQFGLKPVEANSLRHLGLVEYFLGNHREARDQFAAALELYVEIGDRQGEGMAINNLGGATFELSDYMQAGIYYSRSLDLCREIGDRLGEGRALNNLGIVAVTQADYARAEDYYLQALHISREIGHRTAEMAALDNLGNLSLYRYQFAQAKRYHQDSLQGAREIGDKVSESYSLINLARGCLLTGDYSGGFKYIHTGLALVREIGDLQGECAQLANLSHYYCETGEIDVARVHAQQALDQAREHGFQSEEGGALHWLGEAALVSGQAQAAYEYFLAAVEVRSEVGEVKEACDSQAGMARSYLSMGKLDQALLQVEELLTKWQAQGMLGLDQPIMDLLSCYKILSAANDPRAPELLERGYRLLQECANNIEEDDQRQAFLQKVPHNRELVEIWLASGMNVEGKI